MTQQQEKEKACIQIIMGIRNRMKLMHKQTCEDLIKLSKTHNVTVEDLITLLREKL